MHIFVIYTNVYHMSCGYQYGSSNSSIPAPFDMISISEEETARNVLLTGRTEDEQQEQDEENSLMTMNVRNALHVISRKRKKDFPSPPLMNLITSDQLLPVHLPSNNAVAANHFHIITKNNFYSLAKSLLLQSTVHKRAAGGVIVTRLHGPNCSLQLRDL